METTDTIQPRVRRYEFVCLVSPDLDPDQRSDFWRQIKNTLQEHRGQLIERSTAENELKPVPRLSYPIKRQRTAFLGVLMFQGEPATLQALTRALKYSQTVLRYTIVKEPVRSAKRKNARPAKDRMPNGLHVSAREMTTPPAAPQPEIVATPQPPAKEPALTAEEIDKKLEEIIG